MESASSNIPTNHKASLMGHCRRRLSALSIFVFLAHLSIKSASQAYVITVDAGIENECFHERVPVGTKLGLSFEVVEGGFFDIDVEIKDPNNMIIHQDERSTSGKFTIEATMEGAYQFCFNNKKSSFAPKVIIFDIDKSNPANLKNPTESSDDKETNEINQLSAMINQLTMSTIAAKHDVRYLNARDRTHRKLSEKTNKTIMYWSGLEFLLLLAVAVGQVMYVKRFFELRYRA